MKTLVFRFKVISRGSADNFLAKLTAHLTVNGNGVTAVDTEYSSEKCCNLHPVVTPRVFPSRWPCQRSISHDRGG